MPSSDCESIDLVPAAARPTIGLKKGRRARLQLETLEAREVPAVVADLGVPETPSEVMQAAQMSAFFQQSALYTSGQPTGDPTVSWIASRDDIQPASPHAPLEIEVEQIDREQPADEARKSELLPWGAELGGVGRAGGDPGLLRRDRTWPSQVYAPYVDLAAWPTFDLAHAARAQGIHYFNLASIAADGHNRASWSGDDLRAIGSDFDLALRRQVSELRAAGGDVAISFGGSQRLELAQVVTDQHRLCDEYRRVVEAYGLTRIDFAIDSSGLNDPASILRRSKAIATLQREAAAEGRKLEVWFTMPADPSGLSEGGLAVVRSALDNGVVLGGVNAKVGDEAGSVAAQPHMGVYSVETAIGLFYQLQAAYDPQPPAADLWRQVGVTATIGERGVAGRDFSPADARTLCDFARQQGLGTIGIWSLNRDQYHSEAAAAPGEISTGIDQRAFEFSDILEPFTAK